MISIELPVDEETAEAYQSLSEDQRQRVREIVEGWVREAAGTDQRSSAEIARECSEIARTNGMTPEVLARLLQDE